MLVLDKKFKRSSKVKNRYKLTVPKLKEYVVGDRGKVREPLFWRNNVIKAWCISGISGPSESGDSFWIGIYDVDAPTYAGEFRFNFSSWGGMCDYNFEKFFDFSTIQYECDLRVQEKFIKKINHLIDEGIIVRPKSQK